MVKVHHNGSIINKAVLALGINLDAINSLYPQTHIQLHIIHMLYNSSKYVSWKDYRAVTQEGFKSRL